MDSLNKELFCCFDRHCQSLSSVHGALITFYSICLLQRGQSRVPNKRNKRIHGLMIRGSAVLDPWFISPAPQTEKSENVRPTGVCSRRKRKSQTKKRGRDKIMRRGRDEQPGMTRAIGSVEWDPLFIGLTGSFLFLSCSHCAVVSSHLLCSMSPGGHVFCRQSRCSST